MQYLRRSIWDIEVNSPNEFPQPLEAKHPITAITIYDSFTNHYFSLGLDTTLITPKKIVMAPDWDTYYFPKENELCVKTIQLLQSLDPDTMEGFFSRTFDFPYIHNRLTNLGFNPSILSTLGYVQSKNNKFKVAGRHTIDIVDMDKKFKKRTSYSLKNIAEDEQLSVKKIDVDIIDIHNHPEKLLEYNKVDVEVPLKLDMKMQHLKRYVARWNLAGLEDIDAAMNNSVVVDTVMLREAKDRGIVLPSKPERVETEKKEDADITGGMVFTPIIGVHDWVADDDQSRFYPNLIYLLRMSPENISDSGTLISANGTKFIDNPNAFLPAIISRFFKERDKVQLEKSKLNPDNPEYWKLHEEDENIKFLLNSVPGVTGQKSFRLYEPRIIDSITTSGQALMKRAKQHLESMGIIVVYGDSVAKDTKIFIKDITGEIGRVNIENLFQSIDYIKDGKEYSNLKDIFALTISNEGKAIWEPIKYVMRHKTSKKMFEAKSSNKCSVKITEDHSLIGFSSGYDNRYYHNKVGIPFSELSRIKLVSPTDSKKIKKILTLKYIPRSIIVSRNYPKEMYEFMGLFVGDGSFNVGFDSDKKNYYVYLSAGKDTLEIIEKVINPLKSMGWITNCIVRKNGYDLTLNGKICKILEDFRDKNGKRIPRWLEKESESNLQLFLKGIFESDGSINNQQQIRFCNTNQNVIDSVRLLLWYIGISNSEMIEKNKNSYNGIESSTYSIHIQIKEYENFMQKVGFITNRKIQILSSKKVGRDKKYIHQYDFDVSTVNYQPIEYNDYVYDIEVNNTHTFFANDFLAHNTDSLHRKLINVNNLEDAIKQGKETNTILNQNLPLWAQEMFHVSDASSIKIVFEKVFRRIIYISNDKGEPVKKRYAARLVWEKGKPTDQLFVRGFDTRRSDASKVSKNLQTDIFKKILWAENNESIKQDLIKYVQDLITKFSSLPLSDIAIPFGFSKDLSEYGGLNKNGNKKGLDPEIRGAIYSNTYLHTNFGNDSKVKLLYINKIGKNETKINAAKEGSKTLIEIDKIEDEQYPPTDVICFEEESKLPKVEVNYEKMIDATIRKKIERILEAVGISWKEIEGIKSLFDFED